MRITNFIKNYLFTIIFIITLLISFCVIIFPPKMYAQSTTGNPSCECQRIVCNIDVPSEEQKTCIRVDNSCKCPGPKQYTKCDNEWKIVCAKKSRVLIFSCCHRENDCFPPYCNVYGLGTPHECKNCVTFAIPTLVGCEIRNCECDDPINCGKCNYKQI